MSESVLPSSRYYTTPVRIHEGADPGERASDEGHSMLDRPRDGERKVKISLRCLPEPIIIRHVDDHVGVLAG